MGGKVGGRRRIPNHLKVLHGNPGKKAIKPTIDEQIKIDALKEPPKWLNDEYREHWKYYMDNVPLGMLRKLDRQVLISLIAAVVEHEHAVKDVMANGQTVIHPVTNVKTLSPAFRAMDKQAMAILRLSSELGFSPTSRARIPVPKHLQDEDEDDQENPFAKFG